MCQLNKYKREIHSQLEGNSNFLALFNTKFIL